jgi:hypothetical protein
MVFVRIFLVCLLCLSAAATLHAQDEHTGKAREGELTPDDVPHTLTYQGTLFTREGQPVADGEYKITVRMYSDSDGLNSIWEGTYTAPVHNGVFALTLGSGSTP